MQNTVGQHVNFYGDLALREEVPCHRYRYPHAARKTHSPFPPSLILVPSLRHGHESEKKNPCWQDQVQDRLVPDLAHVPILIALSIGNSLTGYEKRD